ncbi:MAG: DUF2520 domain-containing protein [Sphingobacteriales bacterium]|nr:MAG: DUF2520 domain-containing protein [Sphingobacteriales bacterium]
MTFYIIGSGNMAWFLVTRLTGAGHVCKGVYSRNHDTGSQLADAFGLKQLSSPEEIQDDADCCIMAIADGAIDEVVKRLSLSNTVLLHTAGAASINLLSSATQHYGVLWLIYSIVKNNLPEHRQIPCAYEYSDTRAKEVIQQLANSITDITYEADGTSRKWLHLCAVLSNNFTNHMMAITDELCRREGIPFDMLRPILSQTFERTTTTPPRALQTGPARRNDEKTMTSHMKMLDDHPEWQRIYQAVNESIKAMYKSGNQ